MRASCIKSLREKGNTRRTVAGSDTYEVRFPDNDLEIRFHVAVGKIRRRDIAASDFKSPPLFVWWWGLIGFLHRRNVSQNKIIGRGSV